jgi:hypothetical protein
MSGGNGGGKGFFDSLANVDSLSGKGNFFNNLGNDILNVGVQSMSGGFVGFENGKISNGVSTNIAKSTGQAVVSGLKTVTGAKAAEEANKIATQQFEEQKASAIADRQESYRQAGLQQVQTSQQAGAARSTSRSAAATSNTNKGAFNLGGDEKDFLGV